MTDTVRRSPLHDRHVALGAKLVPFGGWEMPLSYPSGTLAEHAACREAAVAFDVSHLGSVRLVGRRSFAKLQRTLTNDLAKIGPGRAQYTHLLDEADASVVDDIIVWWIDEDVFEVMPNASNTSRVVEAVGGDDITATRAVIAVQGPYARARLEQVAPGAAAVGRFHARRLDWRGVPLTVAGTGYTGEDGVEVSVPAEEAAHFWDEVTSGAGVTPAGLGARDTLRLEAGLPLHGHELGPGITPAQAGLDWVVSWEKATGFRGRDALAAEREHGVKRRLQGLSVPGRRSPRAQQAVLVCGSKVGGVTSGNFSPTLGHGIALALLAPGIEVGTTVGVEARGTTLAAELVKLPFVARGRARPSPAA